MARVEFAGHGFERSRVVGSRAERLRDLAAFILGEPHDVKSRRNLDHEWIDHRLDHIESDLNRMEHEDAYD